MGDGVEVGRDPRRCCFLSDAQVEIRVEIKR